jgi:hypothetical protein
MKTLGCHCPRFFVLLFIIIGTQRIQSSCSSRSSSTKVPFSGLNFQWNASLDRDTGKASSYEVSSTGTSRQQRSEPSSVDKTARMIIESCFQKYPLWLCSKQVTFGLLRATSPAASVSTTQIGDDTSIQDSIFRWNLLIFGIPRRKQEVVLITKTTTTTSRSKNRIGSTNNNKMVKITYEYPIKGGILTYRSSLTTSLTDEERGSIQLSLLYPQPNKFTTSNTPWIIESEVVNFQPSIGGPPPVPRVRQLMYLYSQRLVHAYVMRQFHLFCHKSYTTA